ncbi:hypothetical protein GA830_16345 [Mesorhizobium sp. NBSH29]|uniref:hypothetical protein n=1 Tax=Mesorhizobium sp. NBSH29 TaxID=2654249 RepID=UPI0018964470|nr:hypothetical protein [Mesorhizobium sp. NBSH29]QPC88147.1 hypothetical protein GA830_16345 [Mesorhizobium sp. NBSH29]
MNASPFLRIIDMVSEAGDPQRVNEDAAGGNRCSAFVIDGATGLGTKPIVGLEGSDAAWLARLAKTFFEQKITPARAMADLVRTLNKQAATVIHETGGGLPIAAWNLPVASFQLVRVESGGLVTYGLGDCRLFLADVQGRMIETTALKGSQARESENARKAIAHAGGLAAIQSLANDPTVRDELRRHRGCYNSEGGSVWTLGTEPAAAKHLVCEQLPAKLPAIGLLCTDGFAALCDLYNRYDPKGLVEAAHTCGLKALMAQLRTIEKSEDPDGQRYPRFKVSDDATALLFEVMP